ncbi:MAG TPA: DUF4870 domain-containing protein, partial [Egibacteraceae bacterium]|nr:DUF4870 domain-containing protein [Egibacteraceae bacterium]
CDSWDAAGAGPPSQESHNWAMAAHLSAFVVFLGLPLPFVGPLVVWLLRRDSDPYAAEHAREALNFNLTAMIAFVVAGATVLLLVGFLLLPAVGIVWFIFVIIGGVKASNGEHYRYPLTIRFVS